MKKFDKLRNFTQYILYKRARGGVFGGKRKKREWKADFVRSRRRSCKQFVRRGWRYDCRAVATKNGHERKGGARNGDFAHLARLYYVAHRVLFTRDLRFFGVDPHVDRGKFRWSNRGETFRQIARKNGRDRICYFTSVCRRVFIVQFIKKGEKYALLFVFSIGFFGWNSCRNGHGRWNGDDTATTPCRRSRTKDCTMRESLCFPADERVCAQVAFGKRTVKNRRNFMDDTPCGVASRIRGDVDGVFNVRRIEKGVWDFFNRIVFC